MSQENKKISNWLIFDDGRKKPHSQTAKLPPLLKKKLNYSKLEEDEESERRARKKHRLCEDPELTQSPVSGTYIIKEWDNSKRKNGEKVTTIFSKSEVALNSIAASFVEITPQARARLEKIPNRIGPFACKLCKVVYKDAFELAMHNCPRVVNIEYKCSDCGKVFNCPANLASHKRWHKPKVENTTQQTSPEEYQQSTSSSNTSNKKQKEVVDKPFESNTSQKVHHTNKKSLSTTLNIEETSTIPTSQQTVSYYNPFLFHYPFGNQQTSQNLEYFYSRHLLDRHFSRPDLTKLQNDWLQLYYSNYVLAAQSLISGNSSSSLSSSFHPNFNFMNFPSTS